MYVRVTARRNRWFAGDMRQQIRTLEGVLFLLFFYKRKRRKL